MGISKKIILGLMLTLIISITINGFWLKKQYDLLDKKDFYWEFDRREVLGSYNHIKIDGGNKIYVSIVDGLDDTLYYKSEPETEFSYQVNNDTLTIKFATNLFTKRIAGKRWKSYRMVIGCKNLNSLFINNSYTDMELKSNESLIVETKGYSILKIKSPGVETNTVEMKISGNSTVLFSDDQNPLTTDLLKVELRDSSFVNLNKTIAKRFVPSIKDNARIYYGSGIKSYVNGQIANDIESNNNSFN
ncbi:hypothetical protein [Maribacter sp. 4G9]|uniref:hypothetical protein n=1 Tax=Maribacter sp. 4G9 TaxID=1889777 RepID=UPI000C155283|nr:hypothetical protein [Maribacter sp. 4G9]PIB39212.1 hypothetical protein BFP75_12600 [Maribacter sp. 4G9]